MCLSEILFATVMSFLSMLFTLEKVGANKVALIFNINTNVNLSDFDATISKIVTEIIGYLIIYNLAILSWCKC